MTVYAYLWLRWRTPPVIGRSTKFLAYSRRACGHKAYICRPFYLYSYLAWHFTTAMPIQRSKIVSGKYEPNDEECEYESEDDEDADEEVRMLFVSE